MSFDAVIMLNILAMVIIGFLGTMSAVKERSMGVPATNIRPLPRYPDAETKRAIEEYCQWFTSESYQNVAKSLGYDDPREQRVIRHLAQLGHPYGTSKMVARRSIRTGNIIDLHPPSDPPLAPKSPPNTVEAN